MPLSRWQSSNPRSPPSPIPNPLRNSGDMLTLLEIDPDLDFTSILPRNSRDLGAGNGLLFEAAIVPAVAIEPLLEDAVVGRGIVDAETNAGFGVVEFGAGEGGTRSGG